MTPERLATAALEATAYRVRRDAAGAPPAWRPFFDPLEKLLFDRELRVKPLRKAHRLAHAAATRVFEEHFCCEPGEYVNRRRIETVQALLRIAALTVWECAQRVGFTSPGGFEEAYRRLCDETPTETRRKLAATGEMVAAEPPTEARAALRRLLTLQEPPAAIATACQALRERGRTALRERAGAAESWERLLADEWWEQVQGLPSAELWPLLDERLETPAAFETLCRASREEGRADRRRGLELAQLALESLVLLRGRLDESRLAGLEAKGLAELGNAYRLVRDFSAAEQTFATAEERLEASSEDRGELRADVLALKASLYHDEGRFEEALAFTGPAVRLASGSLHLRAEIFLRQGSLFLELGRLAGAIADFQTAFELLNPEDEPYLAWVALQNLATGWHKAGDDAAARSWLERAEPIVRALGQARPLCLRDWLVGLLAANQGDLAQAELHLRRAHAGYERLQDVAHGGVLRLDLAGLYLRLGRPAEAARLAAEALPQLGEPRARRRGGGGAQPPLPGSRNRGARHRGARQGARLRRAHGQRPGARVTKIR